jgi:hypothetical protein
VGELEDVDHNGGRWWWYGLRREGRGRQHCRGGMILDVLELWGGWVTSTEKCVVDQGN